MECRRRSTLLRDPAVTPSARRCRHLLYFAGQRERVPASLRFVLGVPALALEEIGVLAETHKFCAPSGSESSLEQQRQNLRGG